MEGCNKLEGGEAINNLALHNKRKLGLAHLARDTKQGRKTNNDVRYCH
jgi:hypothetical protein